MARRLQRLSPAEADQLRVMEPTFADSGAVVAGRVPEGFRPLSHRAVIGRGAEDFAAAAADLMAWQMQLRSGLGVASSTDVVDVGTVAIVHIGAGPVGFRAPVRVTEVIAGREVQGFVYATLPGHPECGEERFLVSLEPDGAVVAQVDAVSRAASFIARCGGPVTRSVQAFVTRRYGRALRG